MNPRYYKREELTPLIGKKLTYLGWGNAPYRGVLRENNGYYWIDNNKAITVRIYKPETGLDAQWNKIEKLKEKILSASFSTAVAILYANLELDSFTIFSYYSHKWIKVEMFNTYIYFKYNQ